MSIRKYTTTTENPAIPIYWPASGAALDLSSATFTVTATSRSTRATVSPTCSVTGYASFQGTAPYEYNAVLSWSAGALSAMDGIYDVKVIATVGGRDTLFDGEIVIEVQA